MIRWICDKWRGLSESEAATETSAGVLLASGFIAGGTLCGLIIGFFAFSEELTKALVIAPSFLGETWDVDKAAGPKILALVMYSILIGILLYVGTRRQKVE